MSMSRFIRSFQLNVCHRSDHLLCVLGVSSFVSAYQKFFYGCHSRLKRNAIVKKIKKVVIVNLRGMFMSAL